LPTASSAMRGVPEWDSIKMGSEKGNIAIAEALNEKGIKGTRLSQMIQGWTSMEKEEKIDAIKALGVDSTDIFHRLKGR
jgi:MoaA/NifB/PqqE/SkfB family radical SAM enzyme